MNYAFLSRDCFISLFFMATCLQKSSQFFLIRFPSQAFLIMRMMSLIIQTMEG